MLLVASASAFAGSLSPPAGPVAPTPGPEPRIAINATNTPGDADSLYKITEAGSYYLTENLTGVAGKHGIKIHAPNVTIDLMGYTVQSGSTQCLAGIVPAVDGLLGIEVRNGTVRFWPEGGVRLWYNSLRCGSAVVREVRSVSNSGPGITVGWASLVTDCVVSYNIECGIRTDFECVVTRCVARECTGDGILAGSGCKISDCEVSRCTEDGITIVNQGEVSRCVITANQLHGMTVAGSSNVVRENLCSGNGLNGDGAGILVVGDDCRIVQNHCTLNDRGLDINGDSNVIDSNTVNNNHTVGFDIDGQHNIVIRNTATGNTPNYSIVAGNSVAPRVSVTDSDGWAGITNANHPWANFGY